MPESNVHFPLAVLLRDGEAICDAADKYATDLGARLPAGYAAGARTLLGTVSTGDAAQKGGAATVGTLTQEQNAQIQAVQDKLTGARDTAKRAFKGNDVKLREEFQVGVNKPSDLASVLQRARIVLAACQNADNATALAAKGWVAADTTAFAAAVEALDAADDTQETAKAGKKGTTADRNQQANDLYEHLLTIQNAANLQWPQRDGANIAVRAEFRLDTFPPSGGPKKKPTTTPATPQTPGK
ncbi:MAG: hypothetical protein WCH84_07105 [Verrucomicrobiota bacterium]